MTNENKYKDFYEKSTFPVTVYGVEGGKIKEVKVIAYDIDARYGATSKTLLVSLKTPEGIRKSRCSEDFYFLTREEAEEGIKDEQKFIREVFNDSFNSNLTLPDDLFSDDEWKNCTTFMERFDILKRRARIGSYYL